MQRPVLSPPFSTASDNVNHFFPHLFRHSTILWPTRKAIAASIISHPLGCSIARALFFLAGWLRRRGCCLRPLFFGPVTLSSDRERGQSFARPPTRISTRTDVWRSVAFRDLRDESLRERHRPRATTRVSQGQAVGFHTLLLISDAYACWCRPTTFSGTPGLNVTELPGPGLRQIPPPEPFHFQSPLPAIHAPEEVEPFRVRRAWDVVGGARRSCPPRNR